MVLRPIRFENSIQNRIGRPIRFQIGFERKKNDSQVPNSSSQSSSVSSALEALGMMRYINLRFTVHYIKLHYITIEMG